jgi:hypothetical protein
MPPGPPSLLELPGSALEAVISCLGPNATRLRPVSRACRDLVDSAAREIGLLVRVSFQDPRALQALLRKSTVLRGVQLRWSIAAARGHSNTQHPAVDTVLAALSLVERRLEVRMGERAGG